MQEQNRINKGMQLINRMSQGRPSGRWECAVRKEANLLLGIRIWKLMAD
jgi:hypothetical protein